MLKVLNFYQFLKSRWPGKGEKGTLCLKSGDRGEGGALGVHYLSDSRESTSKWGFKRPHGTNFSKCLDCPEQQRQQALASQTWGEPPFLIQWDPARFDLRLHFVVHQAFQLQCCFKSCLSSWCWNGSSLLQCSGAWRGCCIHLSSGDATAAQWCCDAFFLSVLIWSWLLLLFLSHLCPTKVEARLDLDFWLCFKDLC